VGGGGCPISHHSRPEFLGVVIWFRVGVVVGLVSVVVGLSHSV
jgi:hypothetical protein